MAYRQHLAVAARGAGPEKLEELKTYATERKSFLILLLSFKRTAHQQSNATNVSSNGARTAEVLARPRFGRARPAGTTARSGARC